MDRPRNKRSAEDNRSRTPKKDVRRSKRDDPVDYRADWDGILSAEEDVEFDFTYNWEQFKPVLTRMLFGRGGWLDPEGNTQKEFWLFLNKLLMMLTRQAQDGRKSLTLSFNRHYRYSCTDIQSGSIHIFSIRLTCSSFRLFGLHNSLLHRFRSDEVYCQETH